MEDKRCFCVGASKCGDESCPIVKKYIERNGRKFWQEMLKETDNSSCFNKKDTRHTPSVEELENIIRSSELYRMSMYYGKEKGDCSPNGLSGIEELMKAIKQNIEEGK